MKASDEQLANWTRPAFGNEEEQASNTERIIRDAVQDDPLLSTLDVRVFAKGSFKNNTNVRRDSDVDVAVEYQGLIQLEYADGANFSHTGLEPYSGVFKDTGATAFKAAVGRAMRRAFGVGAVDGSGNRVFKVREGSRSLAADVVPCTTYRYYWPSGAYRQGIELILDQPDGKRHYNYPEQHYNNGVQKNLSTSRRFKRTVRILKNIEGQLVAAGEMSEVPSYFMECLAYNVSEAAYNNNDTWREIVRNVCAQIWGYAKEPEPSTGRWLEVNGYKWLFRPDQRWAREDAQHFATMAFGMVTE